jgi:DNA processing protein
MTNNTGSKSQFAERDAALRLKLVEGIGPRVFGELVNRFGSALNVLSASPAELRDTPGIGPKLISQLVSANTDTDLETQLKICHDNNIAILDQTSDSYPGPLKEIYDPPTILFSQGDLTESDAIAISIVGTRHATHYGKTVAEKLARGLSMAGFTIVSGLARGIDATAHRGALQAGGRTIAVLGGGILNLYPPEHAELASEIVNQGAILTEALPWAAPKSGSFPKRNRIITGLSLGVIVVEAGDRSGALISARLAMEQGREVFAVPGRIDSRMSRGCHRLIRDGAKLVESVDDVLEELGPLATPTRVDSENTVRHPAELKLTDQETKVLNAIGADPTEFDQIIATTQLPAARVLSTISVLEIRRLVRRISGTALVRI